MHYDLMLAARKALASEFESKYQICYENTPFIPPSDGSPWLKFDYREVLSERVSLNRKCMTFIGMVQIGVVIPPSSGTDKGRLIAKEIVNFFDDGKILETGFISEGAAVFPIQKGETGWMIPVRFDVRIDTTYK